MTTNYLLTKHSINSIFSANLETIQK
jgi:hypothetical protein